MSICNIFNFESKETVPTVSKRNIFILAKDKISIEERWVGEDFKMPNGCTLLVDFWWGSKFIKPQVPNHE